MIPSNFDGFPASGHDFLAGISLDNSKDFFTKHKEVYETSLKSPLNAFLTELAGEYGGTVKIFRPNRDVRFSADKRPYKTNVSGYLEGTTDGATRYAEISLEGLMVATGYYQMGKDQLERYRAALSTHEDFLAIGVELRTIVERDRPEGEQLKTAPRGISNDAPNIDLLKYKSLTISERIGLEEANRTKSLKLAHETWRRAEPLNAWLRDHVGPSTLEWH